MATKKSKIEDMLTKILKIFPSDIYIVYNKYIVGGDKSEENTTGYFICRLLDGIYDELNTEFDKDKIYYIRNLRTEKSNAFDNSHIVNDKECMKIIYGINKLNELISNVEIWSPIELDDDTIDKLLNNNDTITLFDNDDEKSPLLLGKNMFPTISEKNINKLYYSYLGENDEYSQVLFNLNADYFELYMLYRYL